MLTPELIGQASTLIEEVLDNLRQMYEASLTADRDRYAVSRERWRAANAALDELLPLTIGPLTEATRSL